MAATASRRDALLEELRRTARRLARVLRRLEAEAEALGLVADYIAFQQRLDDYIQRAVLYGAASEDATKAWLEAARRLARELEQPLGDVLVVEKRDGTIVVYGKTYDVRRVLKRFGLKWDPRGKAWKGRADAMGVARAIKEVRPDYRVELRSVEEVRVGRVAIERPVRVVL